MTDNQINDPSIGDLSGPSESDGENRRVFQDELETDDTVTDPVAVEEQGENDDPVEMLGIPADEYRQELDKRAFDGTGMPSDDRESRDDGLYEGTNDDLYNSQEDAADQASDDLASRND